MRSHLRHIHHVISVRATRYVGLALLLAMTGFLFSQRAAFADDATASNDERLITIHDNGSELSIVTKASTVKGALEQADIAIDTRDIVEPALEEKLVAKTYQVNVFRARPVVVVDGLYSTRIVSAEQSPKKIAEAAGVALYDEDDTAVERVDDVLGEGGAGEKLIIDRALPFAFNLYGKVFTARSQAATVGSMLKEKGVVLGAKDGVSPAVETPLVAGMSVRVWRDGKQTVTQEEAIAKPIEEVKDLDHEIGYRVVKTPGTDGKRNVTYEIETQNGVEVSRKEIASVTTLEPVKEVVIVGAKSRVAPYTGGGSKDEWLTAAGIPRESWGYVDAIVQRESGWNPNATNSSSGACGLAQALPCSKVPGNPYNPVDSLRWMNSYVINRYYDGSPYARGLCGGIANQWECAYTFWNRYHWY